jgi:hypothetical protein
MSKLILEPNEMVLLKKIGAAKWDGLISTTGKVDGKLTVTNRRIIFKVSVWTISLSELDFEIRIADIDHVTKEKYMLVFSQVSVVLKSGMKYSFPLMSGADEFKNIIETQMKGA